MKQPKSHPAAGNRVATRGGSYSLAVTALVLAILAAVNALCGLLPKSLTRQDISAAQTSGGAQLRIIFSGENAKQPVLSQLTLECQVPVNILFADTKEVEGKAYGQMLLELPCDEGQAEKVRSWLRSSGIQWKEESK